MRCTGRKGDGMRCRWPADITVGGCAVCKFHVRQAERLFEQVQSPLPPTVLASALQADRQGVA